MTINKFQGQTLNKIVVDFGKKERSLVITFVALSRVKNYKDFMIEPFSLERLHKLSLLKNLNPRVVEEIRISEILNKTITNYEKMI